MGHQLTVDLGLGLDIPTDEDGVADPTPFEHLGEDSYEWDKTFKKTYPLLQFEMGYAEDYTTSAAMFVKRLTDEGYYTSASLNLSDLTLTRDEEAQLRAFAAEFNLPYEPKILAIPCYG